MHANEARKLANIANDASRTEFQDALSGLLDDIRRCAQYGRYRMVIPSPLTRFRQELIQALRDLGYGFEAYPARGMAGVGKSWLAAARMRDFPRLARSECHLAAINAISARLRSVTSSIAISVSRGAIGSLPICCALSTNTRLPNPGISTSIS